ncbi:DUF1858 domain-containing protein [Streptococcus cuniculi]|uniref:DUF1858 domain-containing protein n=1 Tax=Streptococcus cuniculi TaxID=1432788 RepID=A0A4Y9JCK4_9STRE|nr:DUF1858 domain-containing protein [Streptococcus cuniculi]MBF0777140.1 DUF1858 domain-containing protein [Streptococcus cuniculi]TFU98750.1 DUF1858 domain-containing protein [Streptococcus cuniculi]
MNTIDLSVPVALVIETHPEVLDILVELGFTPLANPLLRQTLGKTVSLKQGAKMKGIDLARIHSTLEWNGYDVIGGET